MARSYKHTPPTADDEAEAVALRRRVARGDLQSPEERLKQQLHAIVRKWERLFGKDFGAENDQRFRNSIDLP